MTYFFEAASRPGFLTLGLVGICVQTVCCPVHCRMFISTPAIQSIPVVSPVPSLDNQKYLKTFPNVPEGAKYPRL